MGIIKEFKKIKKLVDLDNKEIQFIEECKLKILNAKFIDMNRKYIVEAIIVIMENDQIKKNSGIYSNCDDILKLLYDPSEEKIDWITVKVILKFLDMDLRYINFGMKFFNIYE